MQRGEILISLCCDTTASGVWRPCCLGENQRPTSTVAPSLSRLAQECVLDVPRDRRRRRVTLQQARDRAYTAGARVSETLVMRLPSLVGLSQEII